MSDRHYGQMVPDTGSTFLVFEATIASGVGIRSDTKQGQAQVMVEVHGKWSHGAADTLQLMLTPDQAEEWAEAFPEVAKASRRDLRIFNISGGKL